MWKTLFLAISITGCGSGTQIRIFDVQGTNLTVAVEKTHAHAFLAEYDFEIVLNRNGREIDRADLGADTGGLSISLAAPPGESCTKTMAYSIKPKAARRNITTICRDRNL